MQKETNRNTHKKIQTKKSSRAREVEFNLSYDLLGSHMKCFSELSTWGMKGEAFVHLYFFLIVMFPALLVCTSMNTEMVPMGTTLSSEKPQDKRPDACSMVTRPGAVRLHPGEADHSACRAHCHFSG